MNDEGAVILRARGAVGERLHKACAGAEESVKYVHEGEGGRGEWEGRGCL